MRTVTADELATILAKHRDWLNGKEGGARANLARANLDGANLARANLAGANLDGANLARANLDGANLDRANLDGANLARANLDGANLARANLARANLARANLDGANLDGANLARANLDGANLDRANLARANLDGANLDGANLARANLDDDTQLTSETWKEYREKIVPALCTAGGKTLVKVAAAWDCHTWQNCPMAVAFDIHSPEEGPALLLPRIREFVQLFDAKLIPCPIAQTEKEAAAS